MNTLVPDTEVLAGAIAERTLQELDSMERIHAALAHEPYTPDPLEVRQAKMAGARALSLAQLQNPTQPINLPDIARHMVGGETGMQHIADQINRSVPNRVADADSTLVDVINSGIMSEIQSSDQQLSAQSMALIFSRRLSASHKVAKRHGVSVSQVYQDDHLYAEAQRRAFKATEIATTYQLVLAGVHDVSTTRRIAPQESANTVETGRQKFLADFLSIYGARALNRLPLEQRRALLPRTALVPEVDDRFRSVRYSRAGRKLAKSLQQARTGQL